MDKPLALLTGVGRSVGIGAGIARQLAVDGWDLALNYWSQYEERMPWSELPSGFEQLVSDLSEAGAKVMCVPGDLAATETAANIFRTIADAGRTAAGLILCHCESVDSSILNTTVESFDRHYEVTVRSSWQLTREFALQVSPLGGRIVALTSDALHDNVPYGATKAALNRVVIASARELADRRILANLINPGPIDTGWMTDSIRELCLNRQPTGKLGTPADTANLVSCSLSGVLGSTASYSSLMWRLLCIDHKH